METHAPLRPQRSLVLALYFTIPILLGLSATPRTTSDWATLWMGTVIWVTHFFLLWTFCFVALAGLSRISFSPIARRPHVYLFSALAGLVAARPVFWVRYHFQSEYLLAIGGNSADVGLPFVFFEFSSEFIARLARIYLPSLITWVFFTAIADQYFDLLNSSPEVAPRPGAGAVDPKQADDGHSSAVWMKAEGHYTLVVTRTGRELVHQRFGDATQQQSASGTQVHRSFWVCYDSLGSADTKFTDGTLILADGTRIPVGPSYVAKVKEALAVRSAGRPIVSVRAPTSVDVA